MMVLANLLKAGMPLTVALRSMTSFSSKGIPGSTTDILRQDVLEGKSLSDAMARQSGTFPDLVVNIVRAGEQSGALEEVLRRQAAHFERFAEVQARLADVSRAVDVHALRQIVASFAERGHDGRQMHHRIRPPQDFHRIDGAFQSFVLSHERSPW